MIYQRVAIGIYIAQRKRSIARRRMIRIDTSVRRGGVFFAVIGRIESTDLPELKRLIESHNGPATLDLKGVRLVDREAITFLADFETGKGRITNCPSYIREWIRREQAER